MSGFATLLVATLTAQAEVRRLAVVVGNDTGAPDSEPLVFAEADARKMASLLTSAGGVDPQDLFLLEGEGRTEVLDTLVRARDRVTRLHAEGDETVVLFYYSGHADDERLELGRSWLTYEELDTLLEKTGATVRIAFLDACQSGAMTRAKGGERAPSFVFELQERLDTEGQVVITSSTSDEASQESDEVGGSYFTHYLASALSGAGDHNRDGAVTLTEAYEYVYRETVYRTSTSRSGTQHPTYEWDLAGTGDLVLTRLEDAGATLVLPAAQPGRYAIYDQDKKQFVAEVAVQEEDVHLALVPGTYLVQQRTPSHLEVATVRLASGDTAEADGFRAVEYEADVAKGAIDKQIRKAHLPRTSVHLAFGGTAPRDEVVQRTYMPAMPAAGAMVRWNWRDGRYLAVDLFSGASTDALSFEEIDYALPVFARTTTVGAGAGYQSADRLFQAGIGLRLAAVYMRRTFPDLSVPPQDLLSASPGLVLRGGVHPGRVTVDLEWRGQYVPFRPDGLEETLSFNEAMILFGVRF